MRVITLDLNKKVTGTKTVGENYILGANDIVSEIGEIGQIQQLDGSFINDITPIIPVIPQPTAQELFDNQLTLMDVLATMTEALTTKGTM